MCGLIFFACSTALLLFHAFCAFARSQTHSTPNTSDDNRRRLSDQCAVRKRPAHISDAKMVMNVIMRLFASLSTGWFKLNTRAHSQHSKVKRMHSLKSGKNFISPLVTHLCQAHELCTRNSALLCEMGVGNSAPLTQHTPTLRTLAVGDIVGHIAPSVEKQKQKSLREHSSCWLKSLGTAIHGYTNKSHSITIPELNLVMLSAMPTTLSHTRRSYRRDVSFVWVSGCDFTKEAFILGKSINENRTYRRSTIFHLLPVSI